MSDEVWSWLLSVWSLSAFIIVGRKKRWGWLIGLGSEAAWTWYSVLSQQWGFLASVAGFSAVYAWNWWAWRPRASLPVHPEREVAGNAHDDPEYRVAE